MKQRFVMFVIIAAVAARMASAQGGESRVSEEVVDAIRSAGQAIGMSFTAFGNADNVTSIEFWGSGTAHAFGQSFTPGGEWPPARVTDYHVSIDYVSPIGMRVDYVRDNPDGPIRGGGRMPLDAPQRNIEGVVIEGSAVTVSAWNESEPGGGTITPALATAVDRHLRYWTMTPYAAIKGALEAGENATLSTENGATVINFPLGSAGCLATGPCDNPRWTFKIFLDGENIIEKVEVRSDHPVFGDLVTETTYSDYQDFSQLKFPTRIVQEQGGFTTLDLTIDRVDADYPYVYIPPPPEVREAALRPPGAVDPEQLAVEAEQIADGVWYLTGSSHHSVAVEFTDYVALFECPRSEARAIGVINAVKSNIPNKPIRYAINSHHHFDHASGLRECAAEGATIIAQEASKSYYEQLWSSPPTIHPDRLATEGGTAVIEGVADRRVLTDGSRTLEIYKLPGTNHAESMLIGYLPEEKILIEADVYTPAPPNAQPRARPRAETVNLYEQIQQLGLDVERIAPLHGRLVTIADLQSEAGE